MKKSELLQTIQQFLQENSFGTLSTLSLSHQGYPFGSFVPYDLTEAGELIIFIANIAEHYVNLSADSRACLFVQGRLPEGNHPRQVPRASCLGRFEGVSDSERPRIHQAFFKRHPESAPESIVDTFVYLRMMPERIRWVGGFAQAHWVSGEDYSTVWASQE